MVKAEVIGLGSIRRLGVVTVHTEFTVDRRSFKSHVCISVQEDDDVMRIVLKRFVQSSDSLQLWVLVDL